MTDILVDKEHHLYGGSTAKYWSNCYGWASLVSTLPHKPAGKAADKGTALHKGILERRAQSELNFLLKGIPVSVQYDDIPNWPLEGEELAEDFWKSVWKSVLEEFITGKQIYIEKKLMLFPDKDAGGTADFICMYYNDKGQLVGVIGDLKTGFHRVEPSEEQLLFYLVALYLRAKEKGRDIDAFKAFVYQPSHEQKYTEHWFTKNQILKAAKKYEKAIFESRKENPKFKVGDWCKFCKCQQEAVCKVYNKHIESKMEIALQDDKLTPPDILPDETLRNIFIYGDQIENYISSVRKAIMQRFLNGKPVEGLKVVAGVSKRSWKKEKDDVIITTLKAHGIEPTVQKLVGITDAETLLKKAGKKKDDIGVIMYELTDKPLPPPKITTVDDPREAMPLNTGANLLLDVDDSE